MANTTIITLNQVIKLFKDFSDDHKMVNDFGYGPTSEIGTSRQMVAPYMWVTHEQDSTFSIVNKTILPTLNLTVMFVDKINDQENFENTNGENSNNGQEVLSDMFSLVQDLIQTINSSWGQYGVMLNTEEISAFVVEDGTDDKMNGWAVRLPLKLKHVNCIIPL